MATIRIILSIWLLIWVYNDIWSIPLTIILWLITASIEMIWYVTAKGFNDIANYIEDK